MSINMEMSIISKSMGSMERQIITIKEGEPDYEMAWAFSETPGVASITYGDLTNIIAVTLFKDINADDQIENEKVLIERFNKAFVERHPYCKNGKKWHLEFRKTHDNKETPFFNMHNLNKRDIENFNNRLFSKQN